MFLIFIVIHHQTSQRVRRTLKIMRQKQCREVRKPHKREKASPSLWMRQDVRVHVQALHKDPYMLVMKCQQHHNPRGMAKGLKIQIWPRP
ncbi:hypothetical protein AB205_0054670 [Aquarana catesbeiana]|uniref:Uncharacterized protein n=1 Tax=Aquarana catesbeiana TaxID=8400 RepID=A0A2G9P7M0_AQUCT|nr:hypothetical protein AB205_0054670 [Aquarana catesbeiana]